MSSEEKLVFTYEEALASLPQVRRLTATAVKQIEALINRVQSREELNDRKEELESAVQTITQGWMRQVSELGCEVKGLWLVDWNAGDGYFCWKYPEETIAFFHTYDEGFDGRVPIN